MDKPPGVLVPPGVLALGDLGYLGTSLEIPLKASKNHPLTDEQKTYNTWHAKLRIGVEHGICRMKKFRIFAETHRGNRQENMIAKNVGRGAGKHEFENSLTKSVRIHPFSIT